MKQEDIDSIKTLLHKILDALEGDKPDVDKINFNLRLASDTMKNMIEYDHNCEYSAVLRRMRRKATH